MSGYIDEVMVDGPLAYYRLNEAAGSSTVADSSGNGHTGNVLAGTVLGAPGLIANTPTSTAASFPGGSSGGIEVPDSPSFHGLAGLTVACWVKTTYAGSTPTMVASQTNLSTGPWYWLMEFGGSGKVEVEIDSPDDWNTADYFPSAPGAPGPINDGVKHHLAMTWDNTSLKILRDGVVVTTSTYAVPGFNASSVPLTIGTDGSHGFGFPGVISDLAVYGHALSDARIAAHVAAGNTAPPEPTIIHRWRLYDPVANETWEMPINPDSSQPLASQGRQFAFARGGVAGDTRTRSFATTTLRDWSWGGAIRSRAHHDELLRWKQKTNPVELTDHLGRQMLIYITKFDPTDKRASAGSKWRMRYTMSVKVLAGP